MRPIRKFTDNSGQARFILVKSNLTYSQKLRIEMQLDKIQKQLNSEIL